MVLQENILHISGHEPVPFGLHSRMERPFDDARPIHGRSVSHGSFLLERDLDGGALREVRRLADGRGERDLSLASDFLAGAVVDASTATANGPLPTATVALTG